MQDAGHLLTNKDFNRVAEVVRRVEGTYNSASQSAQSQSGSNVQVLQIQSGSANDFGYPARIQKWSNSAGTWSDLSTTEVRVEDPNGATLSSTQYVLARFLGVNASNVGCFVIGHPIINVPSNVVNGTPGGSISLPAGTATDIYEFDLTEVGMYEVSAAFVTLMTATASGQLGVIDHQVNASGSGTAYTGTYVVRFNEGILSGGGYEGGEYEVHRVTYWVNVTAATVTITGKLRLDFSATVTASCFSDYNQVWVRRISEGGIVSSLVATVGSTTVSGGTANGLLYKGSGNTLESASGTRINSNSLELKLAADRWIAFAKGSF